MIASQTKELNNKIIAFLKSNTPIKANGKSLTIENIQIQEPAALNNLEAQAEMKYKGAGDLKGWITGNIIIKDTKTNKVLSKSGKLNLIPVYYMTDRGTYIVGGKEKNILIQSRKKPGVYTTLKSNEVSSDFYTDPSATGKYFPAMSLSYTPDKAKFKINVRSGGKTTSFDAVNFFRELGIKDDQIRRAIGNASLSDTVFHQVKTAKTIKDIYKLLTGQTATGTDEQTRQAVLDFMKENGTFGKFSSVKTNIGSRENHIGVNTLLKSTDKLFSVAQNKTQEDDINDLRNREFLTNNDLILEQIAKDFEKFKASAIEMFNDKVSPTVVGLRSGLLDMGKNIDSFMKDSDLVLNAEQLNPLAVHEHRTQTTMVGDAGINADSNRLLKPRDIKGASSANRLDPIDTPESKKAGLVEQVSDSAILKNKTIYAQALRVKNGSADITQRNTVELSPEQEYNKHIAFHDLRYMTKTGNKLVLKGKNGKVPGRYHNQLIDIPISQVDYVDKKPQGLFDVSANMIPFVTQDDGNRAEFGSKYQRQAVVLKNREIPLVSTVDADGITFEEKMGEAYGKPVMSNVSGTVTKIDNSRIIVKDSKGKEHEHQYYNYFPVNQSYINNELKVKEGDTVKKGGMLAEGWQTKDGQLALGINAKVGFMPYKGYNYEDGIVVSESFANKMTAEEVYTQEALIESDALGGRGSGVQQKLKAYSQNPDVFSKLDKDGIIKEGQRVRAGSVLVARLRPRANTLASTGLVQANAGKYDAAYTMIDKNSYIDGIVKRVTVVNSPEAGAKQKVIVTIAQEKPLKKGDKVSGKHGNKGTITLVVPDKEMPRAADGENLDLIFSTAAIPSRKNVGQLFETSAGEVARKTGKRIKVNNFDPKDRDKVVQGLKKINNASGKQTVYLKEYTSDGKLTEIPTENPVTVGSMYIMKLNHKVDDKIQARSNIEGYLNRKTGMPQKEVGGKPGERHNPLRIGEQAMSALQAHQAVWNALEAATFKSDGGGDAAQRMALFNAISTGKLDGLDFPTTPQTLNVLVDTLTSTGMNIKPINSATGKKTSFDKVYDSVSIAPMKPSELIKTIGAKNEIDKPFLWSARDTVVAAGDQPVKKGLIDPDVFGKLNDPESRNKWGYIRLATPIPNPVLGGNRFNPYQTLTGLKNKDFNGLMDGKLVMVISPDEYHGAMFNGMKASDVKQKKAEIKLNMQRAGVKSGDLVSPQKLEELIKKYGDILWKAGGEGIQHKLDQINVGQELKATRKALVSAKSNEIDGLYKKYRTLQMLKDNKMEASDLMMQYVPVAPTYLRNPIQQGKTIINNDINKLYSQLIVSNNPLKENVANGFDLISSTNPIEAARATSTLYKRTAGLTGMMTSKDPKTKKELQGFIPALEGKTGLIHQNMLGKRVDFSGRSVIGVDPTLSIDQTVLPYDMARDLYRPFAVRELIKSGKAANQREAMVKLDNGAPEALTALQTVADDRPVLLNRAPTLHKYGLQAFMPIIKQGIKNIQVNPLTVTGFNADFDGDTNQVYVPVTDKAKEEAKRLMLPSKNLINPSNGKPIIKIRHEMALGIYYLTMRDTPVGKEHKFSSVAALRKAYQDGKIKANTKVSIPGKSNITAGHAMVNALIPAKYRDYKKAWSESDINKVLTDMYKVSEDTNGKAISQSQIVEAYNNLKDLGFLASTRSGISLGIEDFAEGSAASKKIDAGLSKMKSRGKVLSDDVHEKLVEKKLNEGTLIKKDNPVNILLQSGARGNAGQFRRIMGTVGLGKAVTGQMVSPIKHSHFDGLSPQEYLMHGRDSRKGLFDRSVQTMEPGALTKSVVTAMQDMMIKENDCKTMDGIDMNKSNADILGRYAAAPIKNKMGKILCKRGQLITHSIRDAIYKDNSIVTVKVRSPLRCKTVGGVCQKCYGTAPGTMQIQKLGTPIGILSAQALGEPITQMTMNTFHGGGTVASASAGLPKIKQLLGMNADANNQAVLSKLSGKVTKIDKGVQGTYDSVYINGTLHRIPHPIGGGRMKLRVKVGDYVTKGDFLTAGNLNDIVSGETMLSSASPKEMLQLRTDTVGREQALNETRDYLAASLSKGFADAAGAGKVSDRHLETIVAKLTQKSTVANPGSSPFVPGEVMTTSGADKWNANNAGPTNAKRYPIAKAQELVGKYAKNTYKTHGGAVILKAGEQITAMHISKLLAAGVKSVLAYGAPIQVTPTLVGFENAGSFGSENWISNLGARGVKQQIGRAAMYGQTDKLQDSRARIMTGKMLPIGEGFGKPKTVINNIGTSIRNFFLKKK